MLKDYAGKNTTPKQPSGGKAALVVMLIALGVGYGLIFFMGLSL